MITLAAAAYPLSALRDWQDYVAKQEAWVGEAAAQGADLLVFPEYARMELATLEGPFLPRLRANLFVTVHS